jgi:hypothetical protein
MRARIIGRVQPQVDRPGNTECKLIVVCSFLADQDLKSVRLPETPRPLWLARVLFPFRRRGDTVLRRRLKVRVIAFAYSGFHIFQLDM